MSFPATTENAFQMARKFCAEKAGFLFEDGEENLEQCRNGLSSYLTDAVIKNSSSKRKTASDSNVRIMKHIVVTLVVIYCLYCI